MLCPLYENIKESLEEKTKLSKCIYKVGEYRGLGMYVADRGELLETNMSNDINNEAIDEALKIKTINNDLLLETVTFQE